MARDKREGEETARQLIRRAKRASRRKFPAEEKIRIVMEGIRAEVSIADLCRREGIHPTIYPQRTNFRHIIRMPICEVGVCGSDRRVAFSVARYRVWPSQRRPEFLSQSLSQCHELGEGF